MITGVKNGWLDKKTYGRAARKGGLGLIAYLEPNGDLRNVCVGTAKQNDRKYDLNRPRNTGDLHGQAPVLVRICTALRWSFIDSRPCAFHLFPECPRFWLSR